MTQLILPAATFDAGYLDPDFEKFCSLRSAQLLEGGKVPDSLSVTQWIALMDEHVLEAHDHDARVFTMKETAALGILGGTDYESYARLSCDVANLTKSATNTAESAVGPIRPRNAAHDAACVSSGSYVAYWWGFKIRMNHCLCNDVLGLVAVGAGVTAIVAAILAVVPGGQAAAAALGVIAGVLAIYAGAIAWCDNHCNGQGAYINATWLSVSTPWISTVC